MGQVVDLGLNQSTTGAKRLLRVQFHANISYQSRSQMVLTGSLPQLTSWGYGCCMKASSTSWQYDIDIEVEQESKDTIEFQYMYCLVKSSNPINLNRSRPLEAATPVWQSKISRCKLELAKVLDHIAVKSSKKNESGDSQKVKVIVQATGVDSSADVDLFMIGTNTELGDLDMRNARWMKKMAAGTYHSTIYINPSTSFVFWFSLIRKSSSFFNRNTAFLGNLSDDEPSVLWTSGVGCVSRPASISTVIHLLDNWDLILGPELPVTYDAAADSGQNSRLEKMAPNDSSDSRLMCKICWEEEPQTAFIPCGHAGTCWRCSLKLDKCPICRSQIRKSIRIFI